MNTKQQFGWTEAKCPPYSGPPYSSGWRRPQGQILCPSKWGKELRVVSHAYNPSTAEQAEAGGSQWVWGSSRAHSLRNGTAGVSDPGHHGSSLCPVSIMIGILSLSEHVKEGWLMDAWAQMGPDDAFGQKNKPWAWEMYIRTDSLGA